MYRLKLLLYPSAQYEVCWYVSSALQVTHLEGEAVETTIGSGIAVVVLIRNKLGGIKSRNRVSSHKDGGNMLLDRQIAQQGTLVGPSQFIQATVSTEVFTDDISKSSREIVLNHFDGVAKVLLRRDISTVRSKDLLKLVRSVVRRSLDA